MLNYFARRILTMILTLLVVSALVFVIIQLPEGDYLTSYIAELESQGEAVDPQKIAYLKEEFGLDKPVWLQYLSWIGGVVQGDFGRSIEFDLPVTEVIGEVFVFSLILNFSIIVFIYIVAFPIGVYSATHQYSWGDHGLTFVGFIGLATPNFLLALILMFLARKYFGTSIGGLVDPSFENQPWTFDKILSLLEHLIVPVVVIGTSGTAGMIRRLRANLLDELHKQYVVTARAKGLPEGKLLLKYPLRMALNPFIADIGNLLPQVISGAVIVAVIMDLPTTGPVILDALTSQDMFLAGSFLLFVSLLTVVGMFISDLLLAVLDPRIRLEGTRK
ncbi:MAG: ABC transporter permease [Rhodospirillaceae bacterium]|jgi:peptide/nickel transport system permease protein|nr:ABC transporter permease [Rhodospirillaceae bacterium]MBT5939346.1 ABC transporter permease [Rhodospirillaceae bacterium]MBT7954171.1 ABC transporter permease [Rhodospirillaceae bacterium]